MKWQILNKIDERDLNRFLAMKNLKYIFVIVAAFMSLHLFAQNPIYIVNGEQRDDISSIPQEIIEKIETKEPSDEVIAKYGTEASNGVYIVTLKYDTPAKFSDDTTIEQYLIDHVEWDENEQTARVVLRYNIVESGDLVVTEVLEATEKRLKRKILSALKSSPKWTPATKADKPVVVEDILSLQLPLGRKMPRERYTIIL